MGDLDLYQRNDALPHSYTLKRDEPLYFLPTRSRSDPWMVLAIPGSA